MSYLLNAIRQCFIASPDTTDLDDIEDQPYWIGPAGVQIPYSIRVVPAIDGHNTMSWISVNGKVEIVQTELAVLNPLYTEDTYRQKFAEPHDDGEWYWRRGHHNDISFWYSP